jgi:cob(I)alamin adenosyltransferase
MPIYTKTGDRGKTSLRSGSRVWKDSIRVETYGTIDELNSYIGVIIAEIGEAQKGWKKQLRQILLTVQNDLLYVGSVLSQSELMLDQLDVHTTQFEQDIDSMTEKMPELSNFILPGGGTVGARLQYVRTLARRAERRVVTLAQKEDVDEVLIRYINRLSDLFFTMGRYAAFKEKQKEIVWSPFAKASGDKKPLK